MSAPLPVERINSGVFFENKTKYRLRARFGFDAMLNFTFTVTEDDAAVVRQGDVLMPAHSIIAIPLPPATKV